MKNVQKENMQKALDERIIHPEPINQFREWYDQAISAKLPFADAMALATATRDGKPSVRMVLLKEVDERGFVFYTNHVSRKGKELGVNPRACLLFYWSELNRQVRIEGTVHKISAEESDRYFQTRPRDSQISAVASPQSEVIKSREELERLAEETGRHYENLPVPRPSYWGGYRLKPKSIEFWQSGEAGLHDRILYELQEDGSWKIARLAP